MFKQQSAGKKLKEEDELDLLSKFKDMVSMQTMSKTVDTAEEKRKSSTTATMYYPDVCALYHLKFGSEEAEQHIELCVNAGWLLRFKLPKKEQKRAEELKLPPPAMFVYKRQREAQENSQVSREGTKYQNTTDLDKVRIHAWCDAMIATPTIAKTLQTIATKIVTTTPPGPLALLLLISSCCTRKP